MSAPEKSSARGRLASLLAAISALPAPLIYAFAIFFDKSLSFLSIPLITTFLPPADYGQLDLVLSLVELCGIILALGLADTLIRFVGPTATPLERNQRAAELAGTAIPLALILGVIAQLALPALMDLWKITMSETAVRISLVAATVSGFIDMPLTWVRMRDRPLLYTTVVVVRVLLQLLLVYATLKLGYGANGWLIASSFLTITLSVLTTGFFIREVGCRFSLKMLRHIMIYAVPLIGAGLAAYSLANLSRLFLANSVSSAEIGHFTVATRLATAASLLMYPFTLWWGPRRLAVLLQDGGVKRSVEMWGVGASVILLAAVAIALTAPIFVYVALPASYAPANSYIPAIVLVLGIGQLAWLSSADAYARSSGIRVLGIECVAAAVAIAAYFAFVETWGIPGAIAAMLVGQCARLLLFAATDQRMRQGLYPITAVLSAAFVAIGAVMLAPAYDDIIARLSWTLLALVAVSAVVIQMRAITAFETLRIDVKSLFRRSGTP